VGFTFEGRVLWQVQRAHEERVPGELHDPRFALIADAGYAKVAVLEEGLVPAVELVRAAELLEGVVRTVCCRYQGAGRQPDAPLAGDSWGAWFREFAMRRGDEGGFRVGAVLGVIRVVHPEDVAGIL
jgi:hypothetical protein